MQPFSPPTPVLLALETINPFSISTILSFRECCINGFIQYISFGDWLFPLSIVPWRFIHIVLCITSSFFLLLLSGIPWHGCTTVCLTIFPLKNIWDVSSFLLLYYKYLRVFYVNMFLLPWVKYQRLQSLCHMVVICLVFKETAKLFFRVVIFYIFSSRA